MNIKLAFALGGLVALAGVGLVAYGAKVYAAPERIETVAVAEPWYDPRPLLVSLRQAERGDLARAMGIGSVEDLTLYDLDVAYDPSQASFTLGEDVWFTNTTVGPLPDLVFRVYINASPPSSGPEVRFLSGSCTNDPGCTVTQVNPSAIRVVPSSPLTQGGRLHVKLSLQGTLTRIDSARTNFMAQGIEGMQSIFGGGSSGGDYGLLAVGDGIVSFANFYPVLARRISQHWELDEPSKLGDLGSDRMQSFRARLVVPERAKVAVTGVITDEKPLPPGPDGNARREVRVSAAAIRDFSFLFGDDLRVSERDVHGVKVRSYFLEADRSAGTKVLDVAAHALETFERRFGPYPYTDYSVCEAAIVGGAGGVEFSGLVTAASMFYRQGASSAPVHASASNDPMAGLLSQLGGMGALLGGMGGMGAVPDGMLEFVVAHETAHQWWHGLVGSDSRDHPWADEALAQYSSIIYLDDRYGGARAEKDGSANVKMNYQSMRMLGKPDAPADMPVESYVASIQYAGIIYGKAPYFYRAVRHAVGDGPFFAGMRSYVQKYRFRVAPGRAVVEALAAAGGEAKVRPLERRWLDEMHGDEDLGTLDVGGLLSGLGGGAGGAGALGGADEAAQIQEVMKMLQAAGATMPGAGGGGAAPSGPAPGDPDVSQLLKMMGGAQ